MLYLRRTQDLAVRHAAVRLFASGNRCSCKNYASSDDESEPKRTKVKKENLKENNSIEVSASEKLNRLLASMQTTNDQLNLAKRDEIIAKPGEANRKKKWLQKQDEDSKDIFAAAKKVASILGDEKQTESDLLLRLLGGKPKTSNTTEEGLADKERDISLSELIVGMKIDRRQPQKAPMNTRSEYVRRSLATKGNRQQKTYDETRKDKRNLQRKREAEIYTGSVNLTGGEPLNIFTDSSALKDSIELLPTWSTLHKEALRVQVSHPPLNYFDKIARWTEQGKVWRFPIDNEQDWLDEKDVDFSEHIFLEQHLEGWCPSRGPIRHFMELVCIGLSKNPYITAKEKKEHIIWYKNYFESKKDILKELLSDNPNSGKNLDGKQQTQVEA